MRKHFVTIVYPRTQAECSFCSCQAVLFRVDLSMVLGFMVNIFLKDFINQVHHFTSLKVGYAMHDILESIR